MEKQNEKAKNKLRNEGYSEIQNNRILMGYGGKRYFENVNHGGFAETYINSEDGTIVRAIESIPEKIRDEEKFNKTDNI